MKKTIEVQLDDRKITVSKLPLGKYAELLQAIQEIPNSMVGLDTFTNVEIFKRLPSLLSISLPDVIGVLTIATTLKKEEIEQLGLDEVSRILVAIVEVNNYQEVYENIKKLTARQEKPGK